ncbi:hypothetical protein [Morganella psychrotolerans]|uniref:hypothetical protein n=1 Tax=Morganella psychrotolerans TaxID=368603 RepID=UPI0039AFD832
MKNRVPGAILSLLFLTAPVYATDDLNSLPIQDRAQLFAEANAAHKTGIARKIRPVLARPANSGEIVVTIIRGEGEETRSKPAARGDWVVQNICDATGNEEILVKKEKFTQRYGQALSAPDSRGYQQFRPQGEPADYLKIKQGAPFAVIAPWGEKQRVMKGDVLIRSQLDPQDSYRVQKAAFECTYQIITPAG